jgi:hypothetical protein
MMPFAVGGRPRQRPLARMVTGVAAVALATGVLVAALIWWSGGPGDSCGSTLLAAHIDSTTQRLGPHAELLSVLPRQRIELTSATLEQSFQIRSLRLVVQPIADPTPRTS